ncbi:MAG: GTP-binding protein [Armatimonadetes bacterium]|nr:GTP-binding protein [Armatimonadota bacterium]
MVKIHLVTGFLGAGKTTLLRRLIEKGLSGEKFVLLVNEFGEVGIDGALLKRRGHDVMELSSGCVCCEVSGDLVRTVRDMIDEYQPARLIMESTGIAEPARILSTLWSSQEIMARARVEPVICLVDASAFEAMMQTLGYYYFCQVQAADIVLVNKVDLVDAAAVKKVDAAIKDMNKRVFIFHSVHGDVDLPSLFFADKAETESERRARAKKVVDAAPGGAHDHEREAIFESFVYEDATKTFDRGALEKYLDKLPKSLFRLKGTARTGDGVLYLNWVAGHYDWEPAAADDPQRTALVFIGRKLPREKLLGGLQGAPKATPTGADH